MGIRMLYDFFKLQQWEREVLNRDSQREGVFTRALRRVPWSGVTMFLFIMVFFGVDLGAGIKHTARQIREKKDDAMKSVELQKVQARQWSVEQVKNFREGDLPKPSWAEGGPRGST